MVEYKGRWCRIGTINAMNRKALKHLRADPLMAALIDRIGPIKLQPRRLPLFQALTKAIIHQQLSGQAAGTILGRFQRLLGNHYFPSPSEVLKLSTERLRSAGLSNAKAGYILDIARRADSGLLPSLDECDRMTDEELIDRLVEIKGIGRWTVEMLLIFNLGRPDVLPVHDLGVGKVSRSSTKSVGCQSKNS